MNIEQESRTPLLGLGFEKKGTGVVVLDRRNSEEAAKCVGLIMSRKFSTGCKLCPVLKRSFQFNQAVPRYFKSIAKAQEWLQRHAVMWNPKRRYTRLNFLIRHLI